MKLEMREINVRQILNLCLIIEEHGFFEGEETVKCVET